MKDPKKFRACRLFVLSLVLVQHCWLLNDLGYDMMILIRYPVIIIIILYIHSAAFARF
jgi:hypothetical protein